MAWGKDSLVPGQLATHDLIDVVFNDLGSGIAKAGNIFRVDSLQRRMHNKLMVIDNRYALTGGRGIGDSYFWQMKTRLPGMDVLVSGSAAPQAQAGFNLYRDSPRVRDIEAIYSPLTKTPA